MMSYIFEAISPKTGNRVRYVYFGREWTEARDQLYRDWPGVQILRVSRRSV